ncbi:oligoendopeptidase F [Bacillus sp. BGMRC 2118]|nr:oligoendopeptidase F [Bacillus sp. BGMRC 2118]
MADNLKGKDLPVRSEIPTHLTWSLEDMFETKDKWDKMFQHVQDLLPKINEYKGTLSQSSKQLVEALTLHDDVMIKMGQLYTYAHMRNDEDTTNTFYQGMNERASSLYARVHSEISFMTPELLEIPQSKLETFLDENEKLSEYRHMFDEVTRMKHHVRSTEEEALLAQILEVAGSSANTFGMLNNADITFPTIVDENGNEIQISHGRYGSLLENSNRSIRKEAYEAVGTTYKQHVHTYASLLNGQVKKSNFVASTRNYQSAREAALYPNNIPETVYDQLIDTVSDNLSLLYRFYDLKKKALKLESIHLYDLSPSIIEDVQMNLSYDEAKELVLQSLAPFGKDYQARIQSVYDNRHIDVLENKGKRSGAYSTGAYGSKPYILLNWQDNIRNVYTLTHELGHNVHRYLTQTSQPYAYGRYSIFVAEVASTTNEALLTDYLLKNTNDERKQLYILNYYLQGFVGTVFRQTMFAEFEHIIHIAEQSGVALTPEFLCNEYRKLQIKYYGPNVVLSDVSQYEWARIPHFYMNYYVYQYATGYSAATALSKQILEEGEPAVSRYMEFLKAGSSNYPIEILKQAGVDMTSKAPIQDALSVFKTRLTQLESMLS